MNDILTGYTRVSSILAMIPTMSDGKWGYPMQSIDEDVLQRKADLGTSVHAAIAAHFKDEFCVVNDKEHGYLESYLKWERSIAVNPLQAETRLYHVALAVTGCIDMVASINGKSYIVDFKCTVASDPVKWPLQATFYLMLAESNLLEVEKTALFVQLDPKGGLPKVHSYEITKDLRSVAMSWYNAYNYLMKK